MAEIIKLAIANIIWSQPVPADKCALLTCIKGRQWWWWWEGTPIGGVGVVDISTGLGGYLIAGKLEHTIVCHIWNVYGGEVDSRLNLQLKNTFNIPTYMYIHTYIHIHTQMLYIAPTSPTHNIHIIIMYMYIPFMHTHTTHQGTLYVCVCVCVCVCVYVCVRACVHATECQTLAGAHIVDIGSALLVLAHTSFNALISHHT